MASYLFFFGGLILLYVFSRIITKLLSQIVFNQTQSKTVTIYGLALLFFPGVFVHEISHFLAAILTGVRASHIEFLPKMISGRLKLGSVQVEKTDPLRRTFIAVAPVIGGCLCILGSMWLLRVYFQDSYLALFLTGLFVYQVSNTMFSSKKDLEGTGLFVVLCLMLFVILWFFNVPVVPFFLDSEFGLFIQTLLDRTRWYLGVALGIDMIAILILYGVRFLQNGR